MKKIKNSPSSFHHVEIHHQGAILDTGGEPSPDAESASAWILNYSYSRTTVAQRQQQGGRVRTGSTPHTQKLQPATKDHNIFLKAPVLRNKRAKST